MKKDKQSRIVLVTCGTPTEAKRIAQAVVTERLAACVNFVQSPVESTYTWKGKVGKAREYLLIIKTTKKRLADLEREVKRLHSYDVPEFIALAISEGSSEYLSWLSESVLRPRKNRK
jgi:periplasmic divalent cation tolerance protein